MENEEEFEGLDLDESLEEIDGHIDTYAPHDYISEDGRRWWFSGSEVGFGGTHIFFYYRDPDGNTDLDEERRFTIDGNGFVKELFMSHYALGEVVWKDTPEGAEYQRQFEEDQRQRNN